MTADTTRELTDHISKAFKKIDLLLVSLSIIHHSPDVFGNFVAVAVSEKGRLRISYDRGFFVEAVKGPEGAFPDDVLATLCRALEQP